MIDFHKELNQEQLEAVLHGDGPCLVLAGAGSGKTRAVTYRVAYLLERGVDPSSILLLTFTNKAAREMLDRIGQLVGPAARGVWGGTFHAVANRLLRSFAPNLGYTSQFTILDEEDAKSLIKSVLKDAKIDPKARRFPSPSVIRHLYSYSRNTGLSLQEVLEVKYSNFLDCANDLDFVLKNYQQRKMRANAMDFDDMLGNWLRVMEEQSQVADMISGRFRYILVDEYQDTNALQSRLVGCLGRVHGNVFAVGDDAQSIYAFRGADVKNILAFPKQWPEAKIFKLLSNYRSTPQILEVANESLKNNINQYAKDLIGLKEHGLKPALITCPSARQEAVVIADKILTLRSQGVSLGNMAVLFRATAHSQALEFELMKRDVPYEYRGGVRFFERAHIKDILAFVRIVENVKDETAWIRVLNMQAGIGVASASQIIAGLRDLDRVSDIFGLGQESVPARAQSGWQDALSVFQPLSAGAVKPGQMVRVFVSSVMYRNYLEREYPDWKERLEDLEQLATFADAYPDMGSFLADSVLENAGFVSQKSRGLPADERMILSTIHQAKGLEWDTVFVIHLTNLSFPSPRALEEDTIEEERRLFYVAVTRARNHLFLSYPQTAGYDAMTFCRPSMFIEELSPHLFERLNVTSAFDDQRKSRRPGRAEYEGYEEPSIQLDSNGEYRKQSINRYNGAPKTVSVWKKDKSIQEAPKISYLRDIDDL